MNTALIRPIKTETDYQDALERAGALMSCQPNTPEADELEVLATLIELYEDKYFPLA
jgi:HTH-type transcriptional regulator / antitoxin HigA